MSSNRRQSRWASPDQLATVDTDGRLLPSAIQANMTAEQLDAYVVHYRIQEITHKLNLPDSLLTTTKRPREQSPDPEYDSSGRRTNARPQRLRLALEAERHALIEKATTLIPNYRPPHSYRRPTKFVERVYIPQTDFPGTNFIGQILGPRGASLKAMQEKTGATIAIRGKGSVKEGRGGKKGFEDTNQPLHVVVSANTQGKVDETKGAIQEVIDNAVSVPEWDNTHKQKQLRDLAIMNGTFRDDEGRGRQQDRDRVVTANAVYNSAVARQLTGPHGAGYADNDLDAEIELFMEDIKGDLEGNANEQKQEPGMPPWRLDRLRKQGAYIP